MGDWIELDQQWQQRSQWLFQRCVSEPDIRKFPLHWYLACQSEKERLEWKSLYLQQEDRVDATATIEASLALFTRFRSNPQQQAT